MIEGDGLWTPPADVVERGAGRRGRGRSNASRAIPGPLDNLPQNLLVIAILALLLIVPGWLASNWLGIRRRPIGSR